MDPIFLIIGLLVAVAVIALLATKKKKPKPDVFVPTPPIIIPPVITGPITLPPVAPGTYDPFNPIVIPPIDITKLSARDKRIIDIFSVTEPEFRHADHAAREAGDPSQASFATAFGMAYLEMGDCAVSGKTGWRLSDRSLVAKYGVDRAGWTPQTPVVAGW